MCSVEIPRSFNLVDIMRRVNRIKNNSCNRVEPRTPATVRRALFGVPLDHEAIRRDLDRQLKDLDREASDRWNFDFKNEQPLEGRYEWHPVRTRNRVQEDVARSSSSFNFPDAGSSSITTGSCQESTSQSPKEADDLQTKVRDTPMPCTKQTKLTDYMSQKKRSSTIPKSPKVIQSPPTKRMRTASVVAAAATSTASSSTT